MLLMGENNGSETMKNSSIFEKLRNKIQVLNDAE
jgi:hypothetical protein